MVGCTLIYMLVALAAVGALKYTVFRQQPRAAGADPAPTRSAQGGDVDRGGGGGCVARRCCLRSLYGQSRIFFAMSRDGLLPRGRVQGQPTHRYPRSPRRCSPPSWCRPGAWRAWTRSPRSRTRGTLAAFIAVAVCLLVLRKRDPSRARVFRTPRAWSSGRSQSSAACTVLEPAAIGTQLWFLTWNVNRRGDVLHLRTQ